MTMTEVRRWVESRFRDEHKTRRENISALLWGFLSVNTLGVAAIARGIKSTTRVRHSIKRVWRFLRNVNADAHDLGAGDVAVSWAGAGRGETESSPGAEQRPEHTARSQHRENRPGDAQTATWRPTGAAASHGSVRKVGMGCVTSQFP